MRGWRLFTALVRSKEKAADALRRWEEDEAQLKREIGEIGEDESRDGKLDAEQQTLAESENRMALQRQQREAEASSRDELWKRGSKLAANLQASATIREVTSSESPDLDFTELPALLRAREGKLLDSILQTVLRDEIETLAKDKDIVVRQLDGVATTALRPRPGRTRQHDA